MISTVSRDLNNRNMIYRVSIKSFPDHRHLLQENYVEYKHIFLQLPKIFYKKLLKLSYI